MLVAEGESGVCRVICFSPRHDLTLAKMSVEEICAVVDVWSEQYVELGARDDVGYVQVFENRGAMMGRATRIRTDRYGQVGRFRTRSLQNLADNRHIGRRRIRFCYAPTLRWKRRWASDW